jgi:hypothetical protein
MNTHTMITRSKRKNVELDVAIAIVDVAPNRYIYFVFIALPLYSLFAIAHYFLLNNVGYNTAPALLYLFSGSFVYKSLLNQVNVQ